MFVAEIEGLTVRYGSFTALQDFSVSVPEGCVGLLGPNGAGKTTLIKTMLGFLEPAAGRGHVLGAQISGEGFLIRQRVGYMPEQDCHIPGISAVSFVAYAGELAGMPRNHALRRAHEVIEICGLGEARYRNVETFSTGMRQRIKLAQALVHGPSLLLLDEPTNGLDPRGREEMLDLVASLSHGKHVNVMLCSHLLPDVERVCDHVLVISGGKLQASMAIADLRSFNSGEMVQVVDIELLRPSAAFLNALLMGGQGELVEQRDGRYRLKLKGRSDEVSRRVFSAAAETGAPLRGMMPAVRSLEEAFMEAIA